MRTVEEPSGGNKILNNTYFKTIFARVISTKIKYLTFSIRAKISGEIENFRSNTCFLNALDHSRIIFQSCDLFTVPFYRLTSQGSSSFMYKRVLREIYSGRSYGFLLLFRCTVGEYSIRHKTVLGGIQKPRS